MPLRDLFSAAGKRLTLEFENTQFQHAGLRGGGREASVREFLKQHLPKRFSIGSGEVIAANGEYSRQHDVIVYDAFNCPVLQEAEGTGLFPAESVYAVIEVASRLDSDKFREDVKKLRTVKDLPRDKLLPVRSPVGLAFAYEAPPPVTAIFAFEGVAIESIAAAAADLETDDNVRLHDALAMACILKQGLLVVNLGEDKRAAMFGGRPSVHEFGDNCLLMFYLFLLAFLSMSFSAPVDLWPYLLNPPIQGRVRPLESFRSET